MNENISIELVNDGRYSVINKDVFKSVVGQTQARKTIQFFINSHLPLNPFPTLLLTGSHGLGKSMFAELISKALDRQFIEINCSKITEDEEFMEIIFNKILDDRHPVTLLFDEAHELSTELTTSLLTILNPNKSYVNKIPHKNVTLLWDLRSINVIFATTDAYKIFKPLRSRCQEVYFYPYSEDELYQIVKNNLPDVNVTCSLNDLAMVCRARARDAFVFATNIQRYLSISENNKSFSQKGLEELKGMLGILHLGLKRSEVELLEEIGKHGPISSINLATKLMVNQKNIEEELEIRVRELGLIESTPRGRAITDTGKKYLKEYTLNVY